MRRPLPLLPVLLVALSLLPRPAAAERARWALQPPAAPEPVRVQRVSLQTPDGPASGVLAVVDLTHPRVDVVVTGPPDGPVEAPAEVRLERVRDFAEEAGLALAVNANYFGTLGVNADVLGLCVSDGAVVSPPRSFGGVADPVLVFDRDARAAVRVPADADAAGPSGLGVAGAFDAVAGIGASPTDPDHGGLLVLDGVSRGASARVEPLARHPRTAAGVDARGETLFLVVIDGRQPGWSVGVTLPELADLLIAAGADDALNLDGGGSSVMVLGPEVWLQPRAAATRPFEDRPVAASLGIRLRPAPDPPAVAVPAGAPD